MYWIVNIIITCLYSTIVIATTINFKEVVSIGINIIVIMVAAVVTIIVVVIIIVVTVIANVRVASIKFAFKIAFKQPFVD